MNLPPLAERMRPQKLNEYLYQKHLVGEGASIERMVKNDSIASMILWGPPGTGKTTLAEIIAKESGREYYTLSAINSGVKEVREVIEQAKKQNLFKGKSPILFIDEIHRFNKSQQDSLLQAVEKGWIILIGATTENPSFEVVSALLSRCQVYTLKPLDREALSNLIQRAIQEDKLLSQKKIIIKEKEALIQYSGGDARKLLNGLELVVQQINTTEEILITNEEVQKVIQKNMALYDKNGEQHYDIISAFIKSIRGSDPNAAVYWLARMLEGGEDIKFIARRLVILASEDIGMANPTALILANNTFQAINVIGNPESRILLSQCAIYLATSPKSNSSYLAINEATNYVRETGDLSVPLHLRNAPTKLMKELNYGTHYKYSHDYPGHFAFQEFLPEEASNNAFYKPSDNPKENKLKEYLKNLWGDKYNM
ncbi:replication-associated recombination protein A [Apibacter muscae]|uniref:replication-associated recombination protein A n=1 Tax=Apibacter muscae TaxID=2509004 RepID=UPI0011AD3298|nr:replication-associated recombination protein A [Apibacter muscae]TWP22872.1 replication-associated recombination protein A [Apibacter muscae]